MPEAESQLDGDISEHQVPPHAKPKATAYLNLRVEPPSREEIEASRDSRNDHGTIYIIPYEEDTSDLEATARLFLRSTTTPAGFVEHVFRSLFVPEMRKFFAEGVREVLKDRERKVELTDQQKEKLRLGIPSLDEWEASSQTSASPFSLQSE